MIRDFPRTEGLLGVAYRTMDPALRLRLYD